MQVRFDSLNRFEIPTFYVCNPGCVYENNTLTNVLGCISGTSDEELIMNFNTTSELNMRVHKIHVQDPEEDTHIQKIYKALQNRRLIFVEDVGFFVITNVVDGYEAGLYYKDIQASSCECELSNRIMPYVEGKTHKFIDFLKDIVASVPVWKIGEVNGKIAEKYRTFEDIPDDQNVLAFMLEDMQDAYECIISFDCQKRLINVYDQDAFVEQTSIHLTKDDLINCIEIVENSDDLYTAISVQGDDNLNISPVNPLGTNVIYNFSYYLDWMTPLLRDKVLQWQNLVNSKLQEYYDLNLAYYSGLTKETNYTSELARLNTQLTMYQRCRDNIVASGSDVTVDSYNKIITDNGGVPIGIQNDLRDTVLEIGRQIEAVKGSIKGIESQIESTRSEMLNLEAAIRAINDKVKITVFFKNTEEYNYYDELSNYIYEGSYTDEYITVTGDMTYNERFEQMKTLYDRAVMRLERISSPTQEFDLDVENFIFSSKFQEWSKELETGTLINVELEENDIASLFLSNITVNYDDCKLTMTFGNRFNRFDPKALFNDVLGDIKKSANSIGYIKEILYPVKDGEFDAMKEAIESSGILTKDIVLASTNQEILIDDTGILGRQLLDSGEYADEQIKITNKTIVFTDDGWDTAKTAIGNFVYNNPFTGETESHYGVIAEMLVGGMVLTEDLGIHNNSNSITLNADGFTMISDGTGYQENKSVFSIKKKILNSNGDPDYVDQLYIDKNGNLVINGTISVFSPTTNSSTNLEDLTGGGAGAPQYLHIKYSDDGKTFTGNLLANISDEYVMDREYGAVASDTEGLQTSVHVSYLLEIDTEKKYLFDTHYEDVYFEIELFGNDEQPMGYTMPRKNGDVGIIGKYLSDEELENLRYIAVNIKCESGITKEKYIEMLSDGLLLEICQMDVRGEGPGRYIGTLLDYKVEDDEEFDAYDWGLYTDDVRDEIQQLHDRIQSNSEDLSDKILTSAAGIKEDVQNTIKTESDRLDALIESKITDITSSLNNQLDHTTSGIDEKYNLIISDINAQFNSYKSDIGQYLTFNENGLTLGAASSEFKTVIDNRGMYFKQGSATVSYVNNNQLYIPNAVIENTLILGNSNKCFFFSPREDGGVSLTWQAEQEDA